MKAASVPVKSPTPPTNQTDKKEEYPMKFDRLKLIQRIDEIEAARKKAHDEAFKPRLAAWENAVAEYRAERAPQLVSQFRVLADKARKGVVLDTEMIRKALEGDNYKGFVYPQDPASDSAWRKLTEKPTKEPYRPDRGMAALRALLMQTTKDEYVTTSVLRELGFKPQTFITAAV